MFVNYVMQPLNTLGCYKILFSQRMEYDNLKISRNLRILPSKETLKKKSCMKIFSKKFKFYGQVVDERNLVILWCC